MRRIPFAIAAGGMVGVLGLGGLAYAATTGSSTGSAAKPATGARSATKAHRGRHPYHPRWGLLQRAVYAQVVVEGKGHVAHTFVLERGTFTSISGGAIHLTRPDGVTASAPLTAATKFRGLAESSLVLGDRVGVIERDGATITVIGHAPRPVKAHSKVSASTATNTPAG